VVAEGDPVAEKLQIRSLILCLSLSHQEVVMQGRTRTAGKGVAGLSGSSPKRTGDSSSNPEQA